MRRSPNCISVGDRVLLEGPRIGFEQMPGTEKVVVEVPTGGDQHYMLADRLGMDRLNWQGASPEEFEVLDGGL